jgi:tRNA dimethylallyltransferase
VVGGSGQYVLALLEGWQAPQAPPDPALRERLRAEARERGAEGLHARLREADPEAAASIDPRNVRRVIRALEVHHATGRRFSEAKAKTPPPFTSLALGLTTRTRQELHERIDRRVDAMLAAGWLDEVRTLVQAGFSATPVFRASMGYPELARVLSGDITLDEARTAIKVAHHRLARSQYTWFRRKALQVHWLTIGLDLTDAAQTLASTFLCSAPDP